MIKTPACYDDVELLCLISKSGAMNDLPPDTGKMYQTYYFTYCPYITNIAGFKNCLSALEYKWKDGWGLLFHTLPDEVIKRFKDMIRFAKVEDLSLTPAMKVWVDKFAWCLKQIHRHFTDMDAVFSDMCRQFVIFQDVRGEVELSQSYLYEMLKKVPLHKFTELSSIPISRVLGLNPKLIEKTEIISVDGESNNYSTSFSMDDIDKDWVQTFIGGSDDKYIALDKYEDFPRIRLMMHSISTIQYLSGGNGFYFDIRDDKKGSVLLGTWSSGGEIQKTPLDYLEKQEPKVYKAVCDIIDCIPDTSNVERITFACQNRISKIYSVKVGNEIKLMCF